MAHQVTDTHLYKDCSLLLSQASGKMHGGTSIREEPVHPNNQHFFNRSYYLENCCQLCKQRLIDADEIDDFNSVWFGLGPDFRLQPVRAGNNPPMPSHHLLEIPSSITYTFKSE